VARGRFRITGKVPQLEGLPKDIQWAAMPEIVKAAAEHTRDVAPKRRGLSSPKSIASRITGFVRTKWDVGVVAARAPHSHLMELGVKAHPLATKKKSKSKVMRIYGDENILRRGAQHPGLAARPFMQKGVDAAGNDIDKILGDEAEKAFVKSLVDAAQFFGMF
jgi:hypothetical protein